jgi:hypothetical protein
MMSQKPFGRRTNPQWQPRSGGSQINLSGSDASAGVADVPAYELSPLQRQIIFPNAGDEPRQAKPSTQRRFKMPWRQLALMASLCFGIASFVLPDSISDQLDWLLYGLMAISAYAGFSKRFLQS